MKVLHCYRTFYPESHGGVEQALFEMAYHDKDAEVLTLSVSPGLKLFNGIRVFAAKRWFSISSCCVGLGLIAHLRKKHTQIIHCHFPWPFADFAYLIAGKRRPLVITYHSDIIKQRFLAQAYKPLMRWFLNRADRIVATSPNYLASSPILQSYSSKVEVIPLGISESNYPKVNNKTNKALKMQYGSDFMLFIGALRYYKGLEHLINASRSLPFKVLIAGTGGEEKKLKALAKSLDVTNVHFLGFVTDEEKMALLSLCRAVVFPSHLRSEAFGVTLLEGMMAKKPLISCEINTGTSYVNINGVTGHVIPPGDVKSLRNAMLDLWENPAKAKAFGAAARARFEEKFTGEKMAHSYKNLYNRIFSEHEAKASR
jgi:rhamnosyl/mannosyltransferase